MTEKRRMRSIKFPKMFNTNTTNVWKEEEHHEATMQNCITLLHSERGELIGDPYYGLPLKRYLFDQNSAILADVISDMIYTQIALFIPQVKINRNSIEILQDKEKGKLYCTFTGINQIDYEVDTYSLALFEESETE